MQTPAILNLSNTASGSASSRSAGNVSSSAFNQMLSQQIAERRDNTPPASSTATQAPANSKSPEPAPAAQSAKTDTKQNDKADSSKEADSSQQGRTEQSADAAGTPPTATELLAQAAGALLRQQAGDATATTSDAPAAIRDIPTDGAARTDKRSILAASDAGLRSADGKAGFTASLQDAVDIKAARDAVQVADGKAVDKLTELAAPKTQDAPALAAAAVQLQPAAQELAQLAAGKTSDRLTPHVGTPAWDQALGQKVVWMVGGAQQSASLSLNPPDLGPLQIVLNVNNGQADASFYAAQPEVRQALEAALPRLRDMMGEAGVQLGQASVSAGMPERHDQPGERFASQGHGGGTADKAGNDAPLTVTRVTPITQGQGLVDTFV